MLTYDVPPREGMGALTDAMSRAMGKTSTSEWARRCDASLRASRRRRGLMTDFDPTSHVAMFDGHRFRTADEFREAAR